MIKTIDGKKVSFEKKKEGDKIWWVKFLDEVGTVACSFDMKKIYYLYQDYPSKFTAEQKELFDKEFPFWAGFLKGN